MDANGIAAAVAAIIGLVVLLLKRHFASVDSNAAAVEEAKAELRKALAEGRITDAAMWRQKLRQLGALP